MSGKGSKHSEGDVSNRKNPPESMVAAPAKPSSRERSSTRSSKPQGKSNRKNPPDSMAAAPTKPSSTRRSSRRRSSKKSPPNPKLDIFTSSNTNDKRQKKDKKNNKRNNNNNDANNATKPAAKDQPPKKKTKTSVDTKKNKGSDKRSKKEKKRGGLVSSRSSFRDLNRNDASMLFDVAKMMKELDSNIIVPQGNEIVSDIDVTKDVILNVSKNKNVGQHCYDINPHVSQVVKKLRVDNQFTTPNVFCGAHEIVQSIRNNNGRLLVSTSEVGKINGNTVPRGSWMEIGDLLGYRCIARSIHNLYHGKDGKKYCDDDDNVPQSPSDALLATLNKETLTSDKKLTQEYDIDFEGSASLSQPLPTIEEENNNQEPSDDGGMDSSDNDDSDDDTALGGLRKAMEGARMITSAGNETIPFDMATLTPGGDGEGCTEVEYNLSLATHYAAILDQLVDQTDYANSKSDENEEESLTLSSMMNTITIRQKATTAPKYEITRALDTKTRDNFIAHMKKVVSESTIGTDTSNDRVWEGHGYMVLPKVDVGQRGKNRIYQVPNTEGHRYTWSFGNEQNCSGCNDVSFPVGFWDTRVRPRPGVWTKMACKCNNLPLCNECLLLHFNKVWNDEYGTNCQPNQQYRPIAEKEKDKKGCSYPHSKTSAVKCCLTQKRFCRPCFYDKHYFGKFSKLTAELAPVEEMESQATTSRPMKSAEDGDYYGHLD